MMTQAETFQRCSAEFSGVTPNGPNLSTSELASVNEMARACLELRGRGSSVAGR